MELVPHCGVYAVQVPVNQPLYKFLLFAAIGEVMFRHLNALFLGAAVVVLCLHLQVGDATIHIGTHAHLLSGCPFVVVFHIENVVIGVPVSGHVVGHLLPVNALCIIFSLCQFQELCKLFLAGNELCVCPVH